MKYSFLRYFLSLKVVKFDTKMYLNFFKFSGTNLGWGDKPWSKNRDKCRLGGLTKFLPDEGTPSPPRKKTLFKCVCILASIKVHYGICTIGLFKQLSWIHTAKAEHFFISFLHICISVFKVMSVYPIYRCQNAILRVMLLHELKKVQTSGAFHAHDTILLIIWKCSVWAFIADRWRWVWMETLQLTAQCWKNGMF